MKPIQKKPGETLSVSADFTSACPDGEDLQSCVVTVTEYQAGTDVTATLAPGTVTIDGNVASVAAVAGTDGLGYHVRFTGTLSDAQVIQIDQRLLVKD